MSTDGLSLCKIKEMGLGVGLGRGKEKRKLGANLESGLSGEAKLVPDMSKRLCTNGATKACCAYTKQGRKGINQDCMLVWEDFAAQENTIFCGVFDGHGPIGHHVSRNARDGLPSLLAEDSLCKHSPSEGSSEEIDPNDNHAEEESVSRTQSLDHNSEAFEFIWKDKFLESYSKMDEKLKTHPKLNCICSGTTAVTLVVQDKDLVIANVGDSRAILASRRDASLVVDQLTVDFKPNLPGELERIRRCKGRVFALEDEPQVARVWLPNEDTPGLAMARALGDFCLKEYGLSAIPQVSHRRLTEQDAFIVLATDGVWDVMSNEEVAALVYKADPKEGAAKCVVDAAVKKWKRKHAHGRIDDCAVVCHFLKHTLTPSPTPFHSSFKPKPQSQGVDANTSRLISLDTISIKTLVDPHLDRGV